jgi:tetratricopeptide (TPR) repeat protein
MRKSLLILIFPCCFLYQGFAVTNPDSAFYQANNLYSAGNYPEAIELYETIVSQGLESAELYFNLGNAYYKTHNYPRSILNYERALLHNPRDEDILHNLAKARLYIIDQVDEIPEFIIKRWINSLIILFTSNTWAFISIIAFALGILFLLVYFLSGKLALRRAGFYAGTIVLILSFVLFYLSFKSKSIIKNSNEAIIMTPTVTVKSSPRDSGTNLFIIHEGTKVLIVDALDNWYEIRLSDGKQGWMQQKDLEPV